MIDESSPTWSAVHTHVNKDLAKLQWALENPKTSYDDTQFYRGKVHALKSILKYPASEQFTVDDSGQIK
jgi:hypothetical protein